MTELVSPEAAAPSRWRATLDAGLAILRRAPLTIGVVVALWVIGLATRSILRGPSESLLDRIGLGVPALADGRWWTLLTGGMWAKGFTAYLVVTAIYLLLVAPAESRLGWRMTGLLLVVSQVGGALFGLGVVWVAARIDDESWLGNLASDISITPAAAVFGVGLAFSFRMTALWRRRTRLVLLGVVLVAALYVGFLHDVVRATGAAVGLGAGWLLLHRRAPTTTTTTTTPATLQELRGSSADQVIPGEASAAGAGAGRGPRLYGSSHAETRVLVALVVAVSALGALVAALVPMPIGPLATYNDFFVSPPPDAATVAGICADPTLADDCRQLRAEDVFAGPTGFIMSILPALALLVIAEGLRRGKRLAWWLALGINVALIGLATWFVIEAMVNDRADIPDAGAFLWDSLTPLALPLVTLIVLLFTRRHFDLAIPRPALRRLGIIVGGGLVLASLAYLLIGYAIRDQFDPPATFGALLGDLPARFLPPAYLGLFNADVVPAGRGARLLAGGIGAIFWVVTLVALLFAFRRSGELSPQGAKAKARGVLESGGSTLSYMATWPGNDYWFTGDGKAALAYRVIGSVALTTGEPFGEAASRAAAVGEFSAYCDEHGWTPCLYSVTEECNRVTEQMGWRSVQVAEDTVVPLKDLEFTGKKWQDIRTALNKAAKAGVTAEWFTYAKAPLSITDQIRSISEEWVADKGLPEMGFTLGGLDELSDEHVRCLVAVDADRTVHGVTSWMPVYRDGRPVGWTLDFMRRRSDGFRGVMEFLIASAALGFQKEGAEFLSLSGAPLARLDRGEQPGALQRMLDVAGRTLEPVYGFRSLFNFKAKFQPSYEPMYMTYPDPAALPAIGQAIGKAYLPHVTPGQMFRLTQRFLKRPEE
ncbi:lysylphosphatidylglycerol synthetase-like protein (DUF2156 family) [Allocatelliglobosispora scoriae]|uniref:Lysylphosphatidylglycerol synthetase-like protein (DUF2156 family) n=1 Tax=Allocatelliglobosispora scoriae TaxID=643052 RepID=A0A841BTX6_9ACTN|nr:phosphatidylglycerol lysyltransferase domain-containing protein [Allocatelliglobosispora scoriae]MBB5870898.1 lysylphosphatidylglycerol synthetase-like protein (DUF2156 family) [Allocatelliglobosispora scoriae]